MQLRVFCAVCVETDVIPIGDKRYYVKAGKELGFNMYYMHRREAEWGPDAAMYCFGEIIP